MSVNPLSGSGLAPDLAQIIADELTRLAADAQTLQSRLTTGDVVSAVVLPSNGLTDLLDIGGLRVAAELPATLLPGETITVEVTGFDGDRISLHVLPTVSAPAGSPARAPAATGAAPARTSGAGAAAAIADPARLTTAAAAPANGSVGVRRPLPPQLGGSPRVPAEGSESVEARLAAARAAAPRTVPPASGPLRVAAAGVGRSLPTAPERVPKLPSSPVVPRPFITQRVPLAATPVSASPVAKPLAAAAAATVASAARGPATFSEPGALLRALQLPVTASNLAAARLALTAPEQLPHALATLERALAGSVDAHVATLRTLVGFVSRIEPRSPVLAAQIAAFVDQVVTGRETKLVQLLDAHAQASGSDVSALAPDDDPALVGDAVRDAAEPAAKSAGGPSEVSAATPKAGEPTPQARPGGSAETVVALERVVVRQAALDYDLKTQLGELTAGGRAGTASTASASPDLLAAAGNVLTAVTALQLGAATTLAAHPDGIAFVLPLALPSGFAQAQVRINRDAPRSKNAPLDGDNFHIGFILETQHLGTVAIDLQTVGRSVALAIRTEAALAGRAFSAALDGLSKRLESLRYRVVKADATVVVRGTPPAPATPAPVAERSRSGLVDLDA